MTFRDMLDMLQHKSPFDVTVQARIVLEGTRSGFKCWIIETDCNPLSFPRLIAINEATVIDELVRTGPLCVGSRIRMFLPVEVCGRITKSQSDSQIWEFRPVRAIKTFPDNPKASIVNAYRFDHRPVVISAEVSVAEVLSSPIQYLDKIKRISGVLVASTNYCVLVDDVRDLPDLTKRIWVRSSDIFDLFLHYVPADGMNQTTGETLIQGTITRKGNDLCLEGVSGFAVHHEHSATVVRLGLDSDLLSW